MKKTKRLLALGLATILIATSFTGCSKDSEKDNNTENPNVTVEPTGKEDDTNTTEENKKLVIGIGQSSFITDYDNNYFTNYLEEKLGFELEFYLLPSDSSEIRTKIALMATANEDLPDVIITDNALTTEMILQYGSSGFFLPLNEYLADASIMPNYNAIPEEDRLVMEEAQTMADGNMYSLSAYEPETWNLTANRTYINKAWLDQLGLQVPKTTSELKDVLIAFRDGDPNGNGIKDEIGVYGYSGGGYGQNTILSLINAFVFWNGNLNLSEDGTTVIAPYTTDEWREALYYMNDLYNEGLLSANIFTDDDTQFKAILNQETPIVAMTSSGSLSSWPDTVNNSNFAQMELIEPLIGPEGIQYTPYSPYSPSQEFLILGSTENKEMALQLADIFFEYDVTLIERFGEEGVDWTRDPAVLSEHSNAYIEAGLYEQLSLVVTSTVWSDNQSQTWRNMGPRYASLEFGNTWFDFSSGVPFDPENKTQLFAKSYQLYYSKHPEYVLPKLKYTLEEAESIQDQLTTIPSFVNQTIAEFVTGARDIDKDWDAYLSELDGMGLQKLIEVAQIAYSR